MTAAAPRQRRGLLARDAEGSYGLLLGAVAVAFAVQGIAAPGPVQQVLVSVLLATTLLLALRAADSGRRIMSAASAVAAALVVASIVEAAGGSVDGAATRIANALLVVLAPPAIVVGVIRSLRARQQVTVQAVLGVLCVYLLLGMFFAFCYGAIDRLEGDFFTGGAHATVARSLYYSFTTLTTVGYGDLTAASNLGHTLSVAEALTGQIYLVTVVSLIVSNLGRRRQ